MGLSLQKALRLLNHTKLCPNQPAAHHPAYPHQQSQQLVHHVVSVTHQLRWDNSVRNPSHCGTRKGTQGQGRHPEHAGTLQPDASPSPDWCIYFLSLQFFPTRFLFLLPYPPFPFCPSFPSLSESGSSLGSQLTILLPQSPKCWDYRDGPPCLVFPP